MNSSLFIKFIKFVNFLLYYYNGKGYTISQIVYSNLGG